MKKIDLAVIGGGSAGMAAALSAYAQGIRNILIFERSPSLGGVLRQCIHTGFGLHRFHEDLTGTEYAKREVDAIRKAGIAFMTDTTVLEIGENRSITAVNTGGLVRYEAGAVVLAMGCRERSRGALLIPGSRPAGILSAGTAQRYMNLEGFRVGTGMVILGSGDIGLIMARQFTLEGAAVHAVAEIMPYSNGLTRNLVQCLEDFNIPIFYNTTVTRVEGRERLSAVTLAEVDERRRPLPGTERKISCDTLVLSVGLIPENELTLAAGIPLSETSGGALVEDSLQTGKEGVFACGNALHVNDLVDFVSLEGERAGISAARHIRGEAPEGPLYRVREGPGVRGLVPQFIRGKGRETGEKILLRFRPAARFEKCRISLRSGEKIIATRNCPIITPGEICEIPVDRNRIRGDLTLEVVRA
ncbi:MAG: NAD(P)/FAD-dependent oxidoreductase [Treponema sp.]|jgi:NADPH-dependent 2,4-dienoyl-CoA reductase/sulfur reductase-like enzyme|nr:NAD(P)/FAD-dependent oxidoreductase [Treponema sp.]